MKHVVMFSGGAGSWATAKRVVERHGAADTVLLFADTLIEDEDLYRFIDEASVNIGAPLVRLAEGRDPWQVFFDRRFLGNSRIDPCSLVLKREFLRKHIDANYDPADTVIYLGIDWTEAHRFTKAARYWQPWQVEAPMTEKPYLDKPAMLDWLRSEGIAPPRLYKMGFPHNNCGGFCIKAGIDHFRLLLHAMPERYAYHERREQELREYLGKDVAILKDRSGGTVRPLTLKELREREAVMPMALGDDWGGCGCMVG